MPSHEHFLAEPFVYDSRWGSSPPKGEGLGEGVLLFLRSEHSVLFFLCSVMVVRLLGKLLRMQRHYENKEIPQKVFSVDVHSVDVNRSASKKSLQENTP